MPHRLFTNNELKSLDLALISALGFKKKYEYWRKYEFKITHFSLGFLKKKYEYWPKNELKSLILAFGFKKKSMNIGNKNNYK